MTPTTAQSEVYLNDLLAAWAARGYRYGMALKDHAVGQQLLSASRETQRQFVLAAVAWLNDPPRLSRGALDCHVIGVLATLLRRKLPFAEDDVVVLLRWAAHDAGFWWVEPHLLKVVEVYLKDHSLTPALSDAVAQLIETLQARMFSADQRRRLARLREIVGQSPSALPLDPSDVWANTALAEIASMDGALRVAWTELVHACAHGSGGAPSGAWLRTAMAKVERIGEDGVKSALLRWFSLVDKPGAATMEHQGQHYPRPPSMLHYQNADVLKGLVWLCAAREDREIARALTALALSMYRKLPGIGPRCVRVGNACVWALGAMPGVAGIEQLSVLKLRVKFGTAQRMIATALASAAERTGLPQEEVEELLAPTCGLEDVGLRRKYLGDSTVELAVRGTSAVELSWLRPDGKRLASVPRSAREQHPELLKELTQAAADIKKMLPAQRDRIEQLYLLRKTWPLAVWRERYLDHPLVGTLARRLVWTFQRGEQRTSGIWHAGQIVGLGDQPLEWLDATTQVELWHPLHDPTETALAWRDWLVEHQVQQPFKQAHREIYLLTDAEQTTAVYSNRFAAHIIRQHQFNALCGARGWKNQLRLLVDDFYPPASHLLPAWGLRAEFWIEGAGDTYGTDTTESGTYLYLTTDQVRFYASDAPQQYAHAGGGGYTPTWRNGHTVGEPVRLEQIPALLFSEIMRDVDLFVGVASVGNDPTWADGRSEGRYRDYWSHFAFGDLSETAKLRGQVLARLIPRLIIADRCQLTERFLVVHGQLRTYKIHLGSANILMDPNDQYLCIVPARGEAAAVADGKLFLPFEGDTTLAIILSKALLLANDTKIQDQSIVRQIRR